MGKSIWKKKKIPIYVPKKNNSLTYETFSINQHLRKRLEMSFGCPQRILIHRPAPKLSNLSCHLHLHGFASMDF